MPFKTKEQLPSREKRNDTIAERAIQKKLSELMELMEPTNFDWQSNSYPNLIVNVVGRLSEEYEAVTAESLKTDPLPLVPEPDPPEQALPLE